MKKQNIVIISAICLVIVFVLGSYFYKNLQSKKLGFMAKENASTFVREHSLTYGSDDAKVYIVEFFDPACETCRAFYHPVKNLMAANPGKIKLHPPTGKGGHRRKRRGASRTNSQVETA